MKIRLLTLAACLTWPLAAQSALPEPTIDGVVVQDVSQAYSFALVRPDTSGNQLPPEVFENAFNGIVRSQVIRDTDGSYDFYFRITAGSESLGLNSFFYRWQTPFAVSVASQAADVGSFEDVTIGFDPPLGTTATTNQVFGSWVDSPNGPYVLREAVIVFDTDARAYSLLGSYSLSGTSFKEGGHSDWIETFAPAVPEPQTWALMALGLGALAFARRRVVAAATHREQRR